MHILGAYRDVESKGRNDNDTNREEELQGIHMRGGGTSCGSTQGTGDDGISI